MTRKQFTEFYERKPHKELLKVDVKRRSLGPVPRGKGDMVTLLVEDYLKEKK